MKNSQLIIRYIFLHSFLAVSPLGSIWNRLTTSWSIAIGIGYLPKASSTNDKPKLHISDWTVYRFPSNRSGYYLKKKKFYFTYL